MLFKVTCFPLMKPCLSAPKRVSALFLERIEAKG